MRHFSLKTIALATAILAPAAAQAGFCDNGACNESYPASDAFGNNKFGIGYDFEISLGNKAGMLAELEATIEALEAEGQGGLASLYEDQYGLFEAYIADDFHSAALVASVDATVFGEDLTIIGVDAGASIANGAGAYSLSGTVIGGDVDIAAFDSSEIPLFDVEMTFFEARTTYMAGPFPVTVKGDVTGSVGATGSITFNDGVQFGVTPNANLSAGADVSVGAACLRAGVRGELTLINVDVPTTLSFSNGACGIDIDLDSAIEMSTMDGSVEVYAKACGVDWSKKLVSWNGAALDPIELVDESASICI